MLTAKRQKNNNKQQQRQRRRRRVTKNGQSQVKITFQWTKQTQNSANRRRCHRSRPTWPRDIRVSLLAGAQSDALTFASAMASQFATSCLPYDLLCFVNGTARQTDKQPGRQAGSSRWMRINLNTRLVLDYNSAFYYASFSMEKQDAD